MYTWRSSWWSSSWCHYFNDFIFKCRMYEKRQKRQTRGLDFVIRVTLWKRMPWVLFLQSSLAEGASIGKTNTLIIGNREYTGHHTTKMCNFMMFSPRIFIPHHEEADLLYIYLSPVYAVSNISYFIKGNLLTIGGFPINFISSSPRAVLEQKILIILKNFDRWSIRTLTVVVKLLLSWKRLHHYIYSLFVPY